MPGYREVAGLLKTEVMSGKYEGRLPTIDVLADYFSVSRVTMQRALTVLKKEGVLNASPKRGITITRLKRSRSHVLGAVLPVKGGSPLHDQLISGLNTQAMAEKEVIALSPGTKDQPHLEIEHIQQLWEKQRVDGIIIWPRIGHGLKSNTIQYLKDKEIPFVVVPQADHDHFPNCHIVSTIDDNGSLEVMTHLLGNGYKKIAFVVQERDLGSDYIDYRFKQYQKSMKLANLEAMEPFIIENLRKDANSLQDIEAVFCVNDYAAMEIIKIALDRGIRIPHDLVLVGYDNTELAKMLEVSSVEQHFDLLGQMAVRLLLDEIENKLQSPVHQTVRAELIVRNSSTKSSA